MGHSPRGRRELDTTATEQCAIITKHCTQKTKPENPDGVDKCLEKYTHLRLSQEEIKSMNRLITRNKTESVIIIKLYKQTKVQDQMATQVTFPKHLKRS